MRRAISSDPVRLYLKEMGNFQLLTREQEVEIAKRIEAGEQEVEEEVLKSPVMLDYIIHLGERIEAGEADLRDIFEESEEPADPDEESGPEADEKPRERLQVSPKSSTICASKLEEPEEELREQPGPRRKPKLERNYARMRSGSRMNSRRCSCRGTCAKRSSARCAICSSNTARPNRSFITTKAPPGGARTN